MATEGEEGRAKTRDAQYDHFMKAKDMADYVLNTNRPIAQVEEELVKVLTEVFRGHDLRNE